MANSAIQPTTENFTSPPQPLWKIVFSIFVNRQTNFRMMPARSSGTTRLILFPLLSKKNDRQNKQILLKALWRALTLTRSSEFISWQTMPVDRTIFPFQGDENV